MQRTDNRAPHQLREIKMTPSFSRHAEGSCLIQVGDTHVLCNATVEENVPPWMRNSGKGWVTAEYAMLPRSTHSRKQRDGIKKDGRGIEIQRLIGRSLRSVIDMKCLGERQIILDCDVLQADGGTRCAAITGAWVALSQAIAGLMARGVLKENPLQSNVAAISVGLLSDGNGTGVLDLNYTEDSSAVADMNVVMDGNNQLIEVQATGEARPFSRAKLDALLDLAQSGIAQLIAAQNAVVNSF